MIITTTLKAYNDNDLQNIYEKYLFKLLKNDNKINENKNISFLM